MQFTTGVFMPILLLKLDPNHTFWHLESTLSLSLLLPPSFLAHQPLRSKVLPMGHLSSLQTGRDKKKKTIYCVFLIHSCFCMFLYPSPTVVSELL